MLWRKVYGFGGRTIQVSKMKWKGSSPQFLASRVACGSRMGTADIDNDRRWITLIERQMVEVE